MGRLNSPSAVAIASDEITEMQSKVPRSCVDENTDTHNSILSRCWTAVGAFAMVHNVLCSTRYYEVRDAITVNSRVFVRFSLKCCFCL